MGISFGAMGLAQIGGAMEAFAGARAACHPAILAIDRRRGQEEEEVFQDEHQDDPEGEPDDVKRRNIPLPKYVIDSSSDEGLKPSSVDGEIIFQDVSFAYPTRPDINVFNSMSLTIKAGQTVALVGPR